MSMTPEARLSDDHVPFILRGVRVRFDEARQTHMLLAPERALKIDAVAVAILAETDGVRTFGQIVATLAEKYAAPAEVIAGDARGFLVDLMDKRMVEVRA